MTSKFKIGQYVFFGARKGVVIEKTGKSVSVCWLGEKQFISDNVPTFILTLNTRNVKRTLGQTRFAAIMAHLLTFVGLRTNSSPNALKTDYRATGTALLAVGCVLLVGYAFVSSIMMAF